MKLQILKVLENLDTDDFDKFKWICATSSLMT